MGKEAFSETLNDLWEYKGMNRGIVVTGKELENSVLKYVTDKEAVTNIFTERVYGVR